MDSDIKEEMGASTILTGMNGDMANYSRKINNEGISSLGEKFEKNLMALISKLKLESLREPATVLFKEYKKKLGDDKRDDIGPKELSFTLL